MENPSSWNLLTGSLAASDLTNTSTTRAFLVLQGLLRDERGDQVEFETIVREVVAEGPITGPSEAARISSRLVAAGMSLPPSQRPDPDGKVARARAEVVREWQAT